MFCHNACSATELPPSVVDLSSKAERTRMRLYELGLDETVVSLLAERISDHCGQPLANGPHPASLLARSFRSCLMIDVISCFSQSEGEERGERLQY